MSVEHILESNDYFENATHLVEVDGMSTPRVCRLLNTLVGNMKDDETYLEIGTWKGLTLCSAAHGNAGKNVVGCDKFRFYGQWTGWGFRAKKALYKNVEAVSKDGADVVFHHMNSSDLFRKRLVPDNVSVYFYDGDHSYAGTRDNLIWAEANLADKTVLLVDDYNDKTIQRATRDAITAMQFSVTWETYLEGKNRTQEGWWNGLGVFELERN